MVDDIFLNQIIIGRRTRRWILSGATGACKVPMRFLFLHSSPAEQRGRLWPRYSHVVEMMYIQFSCCMPEFGRYSVLPGRHCRGDEEHDSAEAPKTIATCAPEVRRLSDLYF